MVLYKDKQNYYLAWRGRVLLVARSQIREASAEEAAAAGMIQQEATLTGRNLEEAEDKRYVDARAAIPSLDRMERKRPAKEVLREETTELPVPEGPLDSWGHQGRQSPFQLGTSWNPRSKKCHPCCPI